MDSTIGPDGAYIFSKEFEVEPSSKIQYKFRVGHGDWWMLNEDAPTGISPDMPIVLRPG